MQNTVVKDYPAATGCGCLVAGGAALMVGLLAFVLLNGILDAF